MKDEFLQIIHNHKGNYDAALAEVAEKFQEAWKDYVECLEFAHADVLAEHINEFLRIHYPELKLQSAESIIEMCQEAKGYVSNPEEEEFTDQDAIDAFMLRKGW